MNKFSFAISYNVVYKQYRDILKNSEIDSAEKINSYAWNF